MQRVIDLTPGQRDILRSVFTPFAERVDRIGVYGPLVPGADIDMLATHHSEAP